jgi:hypothetical protein
MNPTSTLNGTLAPSEHVLLFPSDFAGRVPVQGGNTGPLPHDGTPVNWSSVARAALIAALLANEEAGAFRIEMRSEPVKKWFGLKTVHEPMLRLIPTGTAPWPAGTLEARILAAAGEAAGRVKDPLQVRHVVSAVWPGTVTSPENETVHFALDAMAARGIIERTEERKRTLGIFKSTDVRYAVPAATATMRATLPVDSTHSLFDACANGRPEVWTNLLTDVATGLAWSETSDNDHDYGDFD